jgi:CPA1 family monovalent cation:H+ antiporter
MRFAVAAMMTGTFIPHAALLTFLWYALGGLGVGVGVTFLVTRGKDWIAKSLGEDTSSQILISLLLPFGAYLVAEQVHCSGILAAVSAGVSMSYAEWSGRALGATRVRRAGVWDTVQFAANGIIFVLLGEQLPGILTSASQTVLLTGHANPWWLAVYVLAITGALALMRFGWVWTSIKLSRFQSGRSGPVQPKTSWRLVAAMSFAGVRGALTLAGILTLPFALPGGAPFPARDLAIFLAAGVIVVSLSLASIGLPRLLNGLELPQEPQSEVEEAQARIAGANAAIKALELAQSAIPPGGEEAELRLSLSARLVAQYRQRIDGPIPTLEGPQSKHAVDRIEKQLRLTGVQAEREEIFRLRRARELEEGVARRLVRELDLLETRFSA